jgi:hypothetical protein
MRILILLVILFTNLAIGVSAEEVEYIENPRYGEPICPGDSDYPLQEGDIGYGNCIEFLIEKEFGGVTKAKSGGQGVTVETYELPDEPTLVTIEYSMRTQKDKLELIYDNEVIIDTGFVSGNGTVYWPYEAPPQKPRTFDIKMTGQEPGTVWDYTMSMPPFTKMVPNPQYTRPQYIEKPKNACGNYKHENEIKNWVDNIFCPVIAFLDLAIEKLDDAATITAQGLDIGKYFRIFGDLPTSWQLVVSSLLLMITTLSGLLIFRSAMRLYYAIKEGVKWW